eukprot:scaffold1596_cov302-Pinguiococcus_pyrenoidosus.AAC.67
MNHRLIPGGDRRGVVQNHHRGLEVPHRLHTLVVQLANQRHALPEESSTERNSPAQRADGEGGGLPRLHILRCLSLALDRAHGDGEPRPGSVGS